MSILNRIDNIFRYNKIRHLANLRQAADRGVAKDQAELGALYFEGRGAERNISEAAKWFHLAAEQGNPVAEWYLSSMYEAGIGVSQDLVQAYMWRTLATRAGIQGCNEFFKLRDPEFKPYLPGVWPQLMWKLLDSISTKMNRAQVERALSLAKERSSSAD